MTRSRQSLGVFLALAIGTWVNALSLAAPATDPLKPFIDQNDPLGARLMIKRKALRARTQPISAADWFNTRRIILEHPEWGNDLSLSVWESAKPAELASKPSPLQQELDRADELILQRKFAQAVTILKPVVDRLEKPPLSADARTVLPYARLSLARALYSSGKFDSALDEYARFTPKFPFFRQVLFEKMWAAFRAGRVDAALGAIASQSSAYFSRYLPPESYIIQIYLYKRLCREREADAVIQQIKDFSSRLSSGKFDYRQWAGSEPAYRTLLELTHPRHLVGQPGITRAEREAEQAKLKNYLVNLLGSEKLPCSRTFNRPSPTPSWRSLPLS
jgi:tetratricopeptide (TPR) repeat protein